ncbi:unnamed protein product [Spirodela intermedia]|uniref:ACB domain-containing protein n=1 Tax=Spirodela intermedia TaxID=51605 RepID=A0A7I8K3A9_SPIIN|nr:unnamed protein product [Spirodela intermedia]
MNPEEAMEKYVALLSDNMPRWTPQKHKVRFLLQRVSGFKDPPRARASDRAQIYVSWAQTRRTNGEHERSRTGLAGPCRFGFSGPIDALIAPRYVT